MSKIEDLKSQIVINEDKFRTVTAKLKTVPATSEKYQRIADKLEKIKQKISDRKTELEQLQKEGDQKTSQKTDNLIVRLLKQFWNWITGSKKTKS